MSNTYVNFFFFKQKTAYEMRISDWSSDVCSSDLNNGAYFIASALKVCDGRRGHSIHGEPAVDQRQPIHCTRTYFSRQAPGQSIACPSYRTGIRQGARKSVV